MLEHRAWPWLCVAVAIALAAPSLTIGLQLDDHIHRVLVQQVAQANVALRWWDMFRLADGDPAHMWPRIDHGSLPWWTWPELRLAFFRPLPSVTHYLDYTLWPNALSWMHVVNVALYAALVGSVAVLYRDGIAPRWAASLALLIYAIDDGHGPVVGWIAHRHALMAAIASTWTLWLHDRRSRGGGQWLAGPAMFVLALTCGETSVVALGVLAVHATVLDDRPLRRRCLDMLPYGLLTLGWFAMYRSLGYGADGSGVYVDPLTDPRAFVEAWSLRFPAYLAASFFGPPAEHWLAWSNRHLMMASAAVLGVAGAVTCTIAPWLRSHRSLRFWGWASLVTLLPACVVAPSDRMLLFPGVFACGFLGCLAGAVANQYGRIAWPRRGALAVLFTAWFLIHLVLAPVQFPRRGAWIPRQIDVLQRGAVASLPRTGIAGRTVVVVGAPDPFLGAYLWTMRTGAGLEPPDRIRVLAAGGGPLLVRTIDTHTLEVESTAAPASALSASLVRDAAHALAPGTVVSLRGVTITVIRASTQGVPTAARFRFDAPLSNPDHLWFSWARFRLHPFVPPPVGEVQRLSLHAAPPAMRDRGSPFKDPAPRLRRHSR